MLLFDDSAGIACGHFTAFAIKFVLQLDVNGLFN